MREVDWKKVNVSYPREEPQFIKVDSQLFTTKTKQYKNLVLEYCDIFARSCKDFKGIPLEVVQHTIPLIPGVKPIR